MRRIRKLLHVRTNILRPNWSHCILKGREARSFFVSLIKTIEARLSTRTSINSTVLGLTAVDEEAAHDLANISFCFPAVSLKSQLIIASDSSSYNNCISLWLCTAYMDNTSHISLVDSLILYKYVGIHSWLYFINSSKSSDSDNDDWISR